MVQELLNVCLILHFNKLEFLVEPVNHSSWLVTYQNFYFFSETSCFLTHWIVLVL